MLDPKLQSEGPSVPEYHVDYCFSWNEDGQRLTILVGVERYSKMEKAVVVPSEGSTGKYAARMVTDLIDLIEECGDKDQAIVVKTDQEPAIKVLVDDVCMARTGARTTVEQAPMRSKGSSGIAERAVQSTGQYLRTLKSALHERTGVRIDTKHPVLTWLCEYAGYMMNSLEVSTDGRTAHERCKSKKDEVLGLEFAEKEDNDCKRRELEEIPAEAQVEEDECGDAARRHRVGKSTTRQCCRPWDSRGDCPALWRFTTGDGIWWE